MVLLPVGAIEIFNSVGTAFVFDVLVEFIPVGRLFLHFVVDLVFV